MTNFIVTRYNDKDSLAPKLSITFNISAEDVEAKGLSRHLKLVLALEDAAIERNTMTINDAKVAARNFVLAEADGTMTVRLGKIFTQYRDAQGRVEMAWALSETGANPQAVVAVTWQGGVIAAKGCNL